MQPEIWTSRPAVTRLNDDMAWYDVEGRDGKIGKVARVTYEQTCLILSTSRLFGKKYVIPASAVVEVDTDKQTLFVDLSKEEVERSPEYDDDVGFDEDCESRTGAYYSDVFARRASRQ